MTTSSPPHCTACLAEIVPRMRAPPAQLHAAPRPARGGVNGHGLGLRRGNVARRNVAGVDVGAVLEPPVVRADGDRVAAHLGLVITEVVARGDGEHGDLRLSATGAHLWVSHCDQCRGRVVA